MDASSFKNCHDRYVYVPTVNWNLNFYQLPKRDVPEVKPNVATIKTVYPGASPEEVERNVTNPLEEKLLELDGLKKVSSVSAEGFSNVVLEFEDDFKKRHHFF